MVGSRDPVLLSFDLGSDVGMACGGRMDVFLEPISAGARVVVIGGGHCGQAVAAGPRQAGFRVTVVDDRADVVSGRALPRRRPEARRAARRSSAISGSTASRSSSW